MVTADEAGKLTTGAIDSKETSLSDRIKAEELALTRTWRGRLRLAKARRAIERAAGQGEFRAEIGRFDYAQAKALVNHLKRQGFDARAHEMWAYQYWVVRVAW